MKVLIVDDEPLARRRLQRLCAQLGGVAVVGEAGDGVEAAERIAALDPDLVLLDISMPGADGLALARGLGERPAIIFVTAHAQHALAAFDAAAVDYLLKPVSLERLRTAIARAAQRAGAGAGAVPRVTARHRDVVHVVDARTVQRFHASDKYTAFVDAGRELLSDESLNALEVRLAAHGFVRVHRGELVRLDAVRALEQDGDGGVATLADGQKARVSRRLLGELKRRLGLD